MNWLKKNYRIFVLFTILSLALFLRVYRLPDLLSFGGDVARDYIAARDIILLKKLPFLGCPSSVPWLHQGAMFTYLLVLPLLLGSFHPLSGGIMTVLLGLTSVYMVYRLGKCLFSVQSGLWAAFFYATSPLIIIFDRLPYHLSPVSFFTLLFMLSLAISFQRSGYFVISSFVLGLLFQLELSNLVFLPVWLIVLFLLKKKVSFLQLGLSFLAFLLPWAPKIIYDFSTGFTQTLGFAAWAAHKILPLEFLDIENASPASFLSRFDLMATYLSRLVFWPGKILSVILFGLSLIFFWRNKAKYHRGALLLGIWLIFPFFGFMIQGSPSESYVPAIFGLIPLLFGVTLVWLRPRVRLVVGLGMITICLINCFTLLKNEYFLITRPNSQSYQKYNWGPALGLDWEVARYIIAEAEGMPFGLMPLGKYAHFPSTIMTLNYLTWYLGSEPVKNLDQAKLIFFVYDNSEMAEIADTEEIKTFPYLTVAKRSLND
jgi:4-amino-4-deoxy-L-arabinose transferase-like glycosyltransferase